MTREFARSYLYLARGNGTLNQQDSQPSTRNAEGTTLVACELVVLVWICI